MFSWLNGQSYRVMQRSLDALWLRQQTISDNIANVDTPGYKSKSVEFEKILQNELDAAPGGSQSSIDIPTPQVVVSDKTSIREDGNNVDIDQENIELVRMQLQYEYMTRHLSDEFARIKYAINEGKR